MAATNINNIEPPTSWLAAEISEDVASRDAQRIAHRIGGIVANDEGMRTAIEAALDGMAKKQDSEGTSAVLSCIATQLTNGV
jgi:hypothetical protein